MLLVFLVAGQGPAFADFQQGVEAFKHGDYQTALSIFQPLAESGMPAAQTNLGLMYSQSWGVTENDAEAVKWYRLAANKEQPVAQNNLGNMYMSGKGGPKDLVIGLMWLILASENGYEKALATVESAMQNTTPTELGLAQEFAQLYRKKWAITRKD